jgi:aspartate/tyrosine/aromatic aminotransferase
VTSFFKNIELMPPDPIFGAKKSFLADTKKDKLDLMVGVFISKGNTKPDIFRAVKKAEEQLLKTQTSKDYLPIAGCKDYLRVTGEFVFGPDFDSSRLASIQTPGGTSAISLGLSFIRHNLTKTIYVSEPTWANHIKIAKSLGFNIHTYPYFSTKSKSFDEKAFLEAINSMPQGSCLLLQASAHNPTGFDLPLDVIKEVSQIVKKRSLVLFLDSAYQGLADGCQEDAQALRYLVAQGHELFISHSFSKSLGLYSERTGALFVTTNARCEHVQSQLNSLVRVNYSNPPRHGSEIVKRIFSDDELFREWQEELEEKREHLFWVKRRLVKECYERFNLDMSYLLQAKGMWGMLPLDKKGVETLKKEGGVYLISNGRVNLSALHEPTLKIFFEGLEKVRHLFL